MAVYRSDQAQLSFGTETSPGAYAELATTIVAPTDVVTAVLNGAATAGDSQLTTNGYNSSKDGTDFIGSPIKIGGASGTHSEIRTVEHATATVLYLNAPLAFSHLDDAVLANVKTVTAANNDQFINILPGVYDTVDVPDPDMTIEPRYFLGTQAKRNYAIALKGQQTFAGSVAGMVLLNARALRFPFGKVVTVPPSGTVANHTVPLETSGTATKGSVFVKLKSVAGSGTCAVAQNELLIFGYNASAAAANKSEIRKHVGAAISASGVVTAQLDYPLQYEHDGDDVVKKVTHTSSVDYTHHIYETVDLDTVSWHLHMRDSGETVANDFDRRYYGGLVGSASLSADEGGMLTMSWDGVNFQGMVHNQKIVTSPSVNRVPYYGAMQTITSGGSPAGIDFPTTNPYFFSQGSVSIFGQTIARIRSFNLTVSNGEEPRYYIQRRYGNQRGPNEIREGRREYTMAVTLALPDSQAAIDGGGRTLFKELLLEGNYGQAGSATANETVGFDVALTFARGTVGSGAVSDEIRIYIPGTSTTGATASAAGLNSQGAIIRTAPHSITGDNPVQVDADILFRNIKIEIVDNLYYYP